MNIVFYCQYVLGMGHFFRSLEIARGLAGHDVTLVVGGQRVDMPLPGHVKLVRLPALYMDERFTTLMSGEPGRTVAEIQRRRHDILHDLLGKGRPDLFMVELYPFGRRVFQTELDPILAAIRRGAYGPAKSVCSLRDILVEKKDPHAYEARVLDKLKRYFDLLLVHSDPAFLRLEETFSRADEIPLPVHYTGFVTKAVTAEAGTRRRASLGLGPEETLIVASAGGGRTGYPLLSALIDSCRKLQREKRLRVEVFSGPFMDDACHDKLLAGQGGCIRVRRFTRHLLDYLIAADLSVSMAGYNTCMDLLVCRTPALVYPYARQQEQPIRAEKLKALLPMRVLADTDLNPDRLGAHLRDMMAVQRPAAPTPLNLSGAENTALFLAKWGATQGGRSAREAAADDRR
jgi:predicted glycosyltransferase